MSAAHESKMDALRTRRAQIDAELQLMEARAKLTARKDDTRRKILAGAVLLEEMRRKPQLDEWMRKLLNQRLVRPRDRALFGLDAARSE